MCFVSLLSFAFANLAVDPARTIAGEGATDRDVETIRRQYGFDRPLYVQYGQWLGRAVTGDLGSSIRQRRPVLGMLRERFPATATLGCLALLLALVVGIMLGTVAALHAGSWVDNLALGLTIAAMAIPTFWFALILIVVFGVILRWLPISGVGSPAHFLLPSVALGFYSMPMLVQLTRAGMIETLQSDYVRTARAKGLPSRMVIFKHALRSAVIPVVTVAAVQLGYLLGGSVVIEQIFAIHGVGFLAWEAINPDRRFLGVRWRPIGRSGIGVQRVGPRSPDQPVRGVAEQSRNTVRTGLKLSQVVTTTQRIRRLGFNSADLPVIQAIVVVMAAVYVGLVFVADVLSGLLDPRIRTS
jgi:peptide/nickel transport system permease protein